MKQTLAEKILEDLPFVDNDSKSRMGERLLQCIKQTIDHHYAEKEKELEKEASIYYRNNLCETYFKDNHGHEIDAGQDVVNALAQFASQFIRDDGWINVEDRLPTKKDQYYLCFYAKECMIEKAFWSGLNWYHDTHTLKKVTHWQPLPEPPKTK